MRPAASTPNFHASFTPAVTAARRRRPKHPPWPNGRPRRRGSMNTMGKLVLAAATTTALGAAAPPSAYAGSNFNGPRLTGVALESLESHRPVVTVVDPP